MTDTLIGGYIGMSLLIGAGLYTLPWYAVLFFLRVIPVRGEDNLVDEWGEFWRCMIFGAIYAAIILAGSFLYDRYRPNEIYIPEGSNMTREDVMQSLEKWQKENPQYAPPQPSK